MKSQLFSLFIPPQKLTLRKDLTSPILQATITTLQRQKKLPGLFLAAATDMWERRVNQGVLRFDHIFDHRQVWNTRKQWTGQVRKARCSVAETIKNHQKRLEKSFLTSLGPGDRGFKSRSPDQNRQFSVRKLTVLTFSKIFSLFIAGKF